MDYRLFDIIYSGLAGALGVMLGAILAHGAKRAFSLEKTPNWLVPVGIVIMIAYSSTIRPPIEKWFAQLNASSQVDEVMIANPLYVAIKEYEPDLYAKIRLALLSGIKSDATSGEITRSGRKILSDYIADKLPYTRDETISNAIEIMHSEGMSMSAKSVQVCVDFFLWKIFWNPQRLYSKKYFGSGSIAFFRYNKASTYVFTTRPQ